MYRFALILFAMLGQFASAEAQQPIIADELVLDDTHPYAATYFKDTSGLTPRQVTVDPSQKTIVLIVAGQSNMTTLLPTMYIPRNSEAISQFNIYDGHFYPVQGPVLGTNLSLGPGNLTVRLCDLLAETRGISQVILVNIAMDGAQVSDYGPSGTLYERGAVAMKRLAARGLSLSTKSVEFIFVYGQGESGFDTNQSIYAAGLADIKAKMLASGFKGRFFWNLETWVKGSTKPAIRAAQASMADGVTSFVGGDLDTLDASYRYPDDIHFNDNGGAAAAQLMFSAIVATER